MNQVDVLQTSMACNSSGGGDFTSTLMLFSGLLLIVYFMLLRPQSQERKKHEAMIKTLTKGSRVVLNSGIHGKIGEVSGDTIVLDVAPKTSITVDKSAIARMAADSDAQVAKK